MYKRFNILLDDYFLRWKSLVFYRIVDKRLSSSELFSNLHTPYRLKFHEAKLGLRNVEKSKQTAKFHYDS